MKNQLSQNIAFVFLRASAFIVVLPVLFVIYYLVSKGYQALNPSFIFQMPKNNMTAGGILPAVVGTMYLVILTTVIALPLGIISAIYLSEYAKPGLLTRTIKLAIVNLAGVPSIVYGLFGLGLFVMALKFGESIIAGALTLSLVALPVIIVSAEEAIRSVPKGFREASLALGATKWQTVQKVVLPNALPGIITGGILGISRAAGETAPILFTCAAFYMPNLPKSVFDKCMVLPYHLYIMSTQVPDAPPRIVWGTALTLLMIVLGMNLIASVIRINYRRKRTW